MCMQIGRRTVLQFAAVSAVLLGVTHALIAEELDPENRRRINLFAFYRSLSLAFAVSVMHTN